MTNRNSYRSRLRPIRCALLLAAAAIPLASAEPAVSQSAATPSPNGQARVSLNQGWRFHEGDPPALATDLRYDARPPVRLRDDGAVFDTPPQAAEDVASPKSVLKSYILPSGNAFISDPAKRYRRPAGDPGGDVSFVQQDFDDAGWTPVTLPHDWAITKPFLEKGPYGGMGRLPSWGIGWYRRKLDLPPASAGKSIFLDIDGAMAYAEVWLNGHLVGGWPYGYNSFRLDLTPYARPGGVNQLAIRLDNPIESSRWYPGGGIYRNVWLTTVEKVHVAQWGARVTTPKVSAAQAEVHLDLSLENLSDSDQTLSAITEVFPIDASDRPVGASVARIVSPAVTVAAGARRSVAGSATIAHPLLWGPPPTQKPNRYVAVTTLRQGNRAVDRYETRFGIRTLTYDANKGLLVNGEHILMNGVNEHHDFGALGAAYNQRAAERKLNMLASMGVNAIRMSHNPPAPELLDLADRMGFLVLDEIFDVWKGRKAPLDFHLVFDDWHEQDLRSMMRRDANHPSVIIWSVGNEVGGQRGKDDSSPTARALVAIAHSEDPTRPVMGSMNAAAPGSPFASAFDVIALNYQGAGIRTLPGTFAAFHAAYPDKMIFSSESAAAYSSRGMYQFPVPGGVSNPVRPDIGADYTTRQVSAYEMFAADFGGTPDRTWSAQDQNPYVAGEFVWTGFDYLGEPAPFYTSRSSYFGIIDLAGFPKDRYWEYMARWRPDERFVHILPHWTFPGREGKVTPVHAFTSGDEAELFVNGKSQGRRKRAPFEYRFRWDNVTYAPGEIKVVAYKDGKPWAEDTVRTAGAARQATLKIDRPTIAADGKDISYVAVSLVDANGVEVPVDARNVHFSVDGPGRLIATDNGDPTDFTAFPSPDRKLFSGKALAIVAGTPGKPGIVTIHAVADGLPDASATITTR